MSDWQLIETAPLDGTSIILAIPGRSEAVIGWYIDRQTVEYGRVTSYTKCWYTGGFGEAPKPTHWMALPEMPLAPMARIDKVSRY